MKARSDHILEGRLNDGSPLAELMHALQAPDTPDELSGLNAAMSAFFTVGPASRAAAVRPRRPHRPGRHAAATSRRTLAIKLAALFGGASVVGGIALASHVVNGPDSPAQDRGPHRSGGVNVSVSPLPGAPGGATSTRGSVSYPASTATPTGTQPTGTTPSNGGGLLGGVSAGQTSHPTHPSHPSHPTTTKGSPTPTSSVTPSSSSKTNPGQSHRSSAPGQTRSKSHPSGPSE